MNELALRSADKLPDAICTTGHASQIAGRTSEEPSSSDFRGAEASNSFHFSAFLYGDETPWRAMAHTLIWRERLPREVSFWWETVVQSLVVISEQTSEAHAFDLRQTDIARLAWCSPSSHHITPRTPATRP
jgi:hypothetical protein